MANFLTRMVETFGTTTMKAMLPDVYFMVEVEEQEENGVDAVVKAETERRVE
ncbi:MAG: hypothetical protein ACXVP5_12310 [Tumebacillaceae bacterium]